VARFRAEIASLVRNSPVGTGSRSTERDIDLGDEAEPPELSSTVSWKSDSAAQATVWPPLGPDDVAAARQRAEAQSAMPNAIGGYKVTPFLFLYGDDRS
jgi:hypothetical protein